MTPLKARIIDMIRMSGDIGISSREMACELYRGERERAIATVRVHVSQINDLLVATDWVITSDGRSHHARWHLQRRRQGRRAAGARRESIRRPRLIGCRQRTRLQALLKISRPTACTIRSSSVA